MKALMRVLMGLVGVVVIAIIGVSLWASLFFDAEALKGELTTTVEAETGHRLEIREPLALSVFPRLGVETGGVTLHALEADQPPLAKVELVVMKVALIPLLFSQLEADRVVVDGLALNLRRDQQGRGNWESLLSSRRSDSQHAPSSGEMALGAVAIGGIDIRNGRLQWEDQTTSTQMVVSQINLKSGPVRMGEPVSLQGELSFQQNRNELTGTLQLSGALRLGERLETITVDNLSIHSKTAGELMPNKRTIIASIKGRLVVEQLGEKVAMEEMQLVVDETTLQGHGSLRQGKPQVIRFELKGDRLDLDPYLPGESAAAGVDPIAGSAAGVVQLPSELLRQLDLEGQIALDQLKLSGGKANKVALQLSIKQGKVQIGPLSAALYKGQYQGTVGVDVTTDRPRIVLKESLSAVDLGLLAKQMATVDALRGLLTLEGDFNAQGLSETEILDTLSGAARVEVTEGAIQGINLGRLIRQAQALIKGEAFPTDNEPNETLFENLKATVRAKEGRIVSDSLVMHTPIMEVTGSGWYALNSGQMEYRLTAVLAKGLAGGDLKKLEGQPIPILLRGTMDDPQVKVELEALLKDSLKQKLQQKIKSKLGDLLGGESSGSSGESSERKMKKDLGNILNKLF